MILNELEQEGTGEQKMGQSVVQMRQNLSTMNMTQNMNTTLNFVKRNLY